MSVKIYNNLIFNLFHCTFCWQLLIFFIYSFIQQTFTNNFRPVDFRARGWERRDMGKREGLGACPPPAASHFLHACATTWAFSVLLPGPSSFWAACGGLWKKAFEWVWTLFISGASAYSKVTPQSTLGF